MADYFPGLFTARRGLSVKRGKDVTGHSSQQPRTPRERQRQRPATEAGRDQAWGTGQVDQARHGSTCNHPIRPKTSPAMHTTQLHLHEGLFLNSRKNFAATNCSWTADMMSCSLSILRYVLCKQSHSVLFKNICRRFISTVRPCPFQ